jgi:hypothetical protein
MPYNNEYNRNIANQLNNLYRNKVKYENACADNVRQNDVMDPLEGMALRQDKVHGGSGTAAATLYDLGYEPTNGVTGSGEPEAKPRRKYVRKTPLPPEAPTVETVGEVVGEGVDRAVGGSSCAGGKRTRKKKEPPTPPPEAAAETGAGVSAGGVSCWRGLRWRCQRGKQEAKEEEGGAGSCGH